MTLPHATSERIVDCLRRLAQNGELPARLSTVAVDEETSLGQLGVDSFGRVGRRDARRAGPGRRTTDLRGLR
jgi:hypothetical protein